MNRIVGSIVVREKIRGKNGESGVREYEGGSVETWPISKKGTGRERCWNVGSVHPAAISGHLEPPRFGISVRFVRFVPQPRNFSVSRCAADVPCY